MPVLDELGIKPVAAGVNDVPMTTPRPFESPACKLIAEQFKAADADTVLLVGIGATSWPSHGRRTSYRPKLLFTEPLACTCVLDQRRHHRYDRSRKDLRRRPVRPDQAR